MPIQKIDGTNVINTLPTGIHIQKFCRKHADFFSGHGFMDGGCFVLASALAQWIGNRVSHQMQTVVNEKGIPQHVVLQVCGGFYVDADGVGCKTDLINKMELMENIRGAQIVRFDLETALNYGIPTYSHSDIDRLAKMLGVELGCFSLDCNTCE